MKRIVTVILSLVMAFSLTSVAFAEGTENSDYFIYQGENYYTPQKDNPAADLQPGEQIDITLSDNAAFSEGTYKLTVVSCGNREDVIIKVNGAEVGTISRKGTGFGMDQMTNDVLDAQLELSPSDTLSIVGVTGEIWGWVDYIQLDKVGEAAVEATTDETADIPKTGETNPVYLLILMAVSAFGIAAGSRMNKNAFNK